MFSPRRQSAPLCTHMVVWAELCRLPHACLGAAWLVLIGSMLPMLWQKVVFGTGKCIWFVHIALMCGARVGCACMCVGFSYSIRINMSDMWPYEQVVCIHVWLICGETEAGVGSEDHILSSRFCILYELVALWHLHDISLYAVFDIVLIGCYTYISQFEYCLLLSAVMRWN